MFAWWGRTVYRYRYIVIAVMVALCLGGAVYGASLGKHVTQSGFYDNSSESVRASTLADEVYGRDRTSHVVAILTPPGDEKVTDKTWQKKVTDELDQVVKDYPDQIVGWVGWLKAPDTTDPTVNQMKTADLRHTFISIPLKGDDDDTILKNYQTIEPALKKVNGGTIQLAGLNPLASELTGTIGTDQQRAELAIVPLVAVVLFFVFGGAVAAALPAIIGGLTIGGALGILRLTAEFGPVHFFAQPVVTMMGFGIAIDYGLFVVSRFREELAEGYDVEAAVRRSVMTSGRTVAFSSVIIVASSLPLLLIPLGFLKSITYAIIASVLLAAFLSITVLPAVLGILGANVDALGVRTLLRVPFLANWPFSRRIIDWFIEKTQKTKTREEVEKGFWGRLVNVVMKRPIAFAAPIVIIMTLLIIPMGQLALGGLSEKYLPPDNPVRSAQEQFDKEFSSFRTEPLTLVIKTNDGSPVTDQQLDDLRAEAQTVSGFAGSDDPSKMWEERSPQNGGSKDPSVRVIQNGLIDSSTAPQKIQQLRALTPPRGTTVLVGGTQALAQDSILTLFDKLPLMVLILVLTTTVLMFLAFGSVVLPIKAALMSALTLGSTMGILTWMFVEGGHGSGLLNYTPQPLFAPMIGLIIAVIWGLSTDYEVFLVSRMVEARERGLSTAEAIRIGTATTGRLITGAALVLAVVVAAFAFSDLVVMKYLAFGLLIALLLDATVIRMFLVPAIMKLLGDDCWWAPRWMKRLQVKIGLGETHLTDERKRPVMRDPDPALVGAGAPVSAAGARRPAHDPTHPVEGRAMPRVVGRAEYRNPPPPQEAPSAAGTARMPDPVEARSEITAGGQERSDRGITAGGQERSDRGITDAPTTRFSVAKNAVKNAVNSAASAARTNRPPTPPAPDREIESWLGELRGSGGQERSDRGSMQPGAPTPPPQQPSAQPTQAMSAPEDATTAIPAQREQNDDVSPSLSAEETRAIPVSRPEQGDSEVATEKLNARGKKEGEDRPRRGGGAGGVSAADLLRREGRL
ncbi:MMPL family transporter [Mycolicibacterium aichiense]|uniref:Membrane protein n=1 Tax=Mycolicibacterium aichiense TaxID=1799 RepID=A0AAD1HTA0_9MYCO|nr:MMPL family transporter [Mycolicibacterium aichiense]MCV7017004.1 MMPL family transporter [Mycolicibacterium aichiense]BBX10569.1 membrane protein [Mycolicibacterium aichiense]STZ25773.1 Drug exporters of the RND superfamily-like protein [Mycolicibacterium aichiense]